MAAIEGTVSAMGPVGWDGTRYNPDRENEGLGGGVFSRAAAPS